MAVAPEATFKASPSIGSTHMHAHPHSQRGLTLIELMVTISVLAILIGLAAPSFGSMARTWQRDAASRVISDHIRLARSEAIKGSRQVSICPLNNTENGCDGTVTDWSVGWAVIADGTVLARQGALLGVASIALDGTGEELVFLPNGLLNNTQRNFTITPSGSGDLGVTTIRVNSVGRVSMRTATTS